MFSPYSRLDFLNFYWIFLIFLTLVTVKYCFCVWPCFCVYFHLIMPQLCGSCGHVKGEWDSHHSCISCTGCSPSSKCSFCQEWSSATWHKAMNRTFQSRKRESRSSQSCSRCSDSVVSGRSGESPGPPDFSPSASDLAASSHMRASPGPPVNLCPVPGLVQTTGHQSIGLVNRPDHLPRYECTSHRTISVRCQCVRFGHWPFYVRFSHRPRYDHSGHRTMSVRSGHRSGCVRFGHRPFCVRFSHQYRLGPSGYQSGLWTPADWSNQHRFDFRFG